MTASLTPRHSRTLALAVLAVLAILFYAALVRPIVSQFVEYQTLIESKRVQLERYRRIVARGQWAGTALKRLQGGAQRRAYYLPGSTPALASAKLQEYIKRVTRTSHGELISTQVRSERQSGDVPGVILRVQMKGGFNTLLNMFYAIETGTPVVVLENVVVASHGTRRLTADRPGAYLDELDIRFDLVGYTGEGAD